MHYCIRYVTFFCDFVYTYRIETHTDVNLNFIDYLEIKVPVIVTLTQLKICCLTVVLP